MPIKLSVCIPTRNRADFISQSLESIISQADDTIEIVIVDGASTDNTHEIVDNFKQKFKNIVYYRGDINPGVDRDMARSVELATGEYCWLFSDDDMLPPGAIKSILEEIESGCELYLCNVMACDMSMRPLRKRFWLDAKTDSRVFNLHEESQFTEYCRLANSIGAFFSYTPAVILKRREWNKTGYLQEFDGSAYAMASTLMSFIKRTCRLKYVKTPLVLWRNDNESFQNEGGLVKRFLLDFNAYLRLADKYLSDNPKCRESFLKIMTREHPWYTIINVTSFIADQKTWENFRDKMLKFGYNRKLITTCYALGRQKKLVSLAVKIKRAIIKNLWINKLIESLRCIRHDRFI